MNNLELFLSNAIRPPIAVWQPKDIAKLYTRWQRAVELPHHNWADGTTAGGEHIYPAHSGADAGYTYYRVTLGRCECPDAQHQAPWGWCKHRLALWIKLTGQPDRYTEQERQADLASLYGPASK